MVAAPALSPSPSFEAVLADARGGAFEFGNDLANHLPMVLWALHRLGGDAVDASRVAEAYRCATGVGTARSSPGRIDRATWRDHWGDRHFEAAYRDFFAAELARLGEAQLLATYLPPLATGIAASALHALMRLAYALDSQAPDETAASLAYWATTWLPLGEGVGDPAASLDPAAVLAFVADEPRFAQVRPASDLLWHFMLAMAEEPAFAPVFDRLVVDAGTMHRLARASLLLYAATDDDFAALHAVTGTHWLRLVVARLAEPEPLIRAYWQAIAALYPKVGCRPPLNADAAAAMAERPCTDWPALHAAACTSNDEHDLSLVYSCWREHEVYGDPLYRVVAARRLGMLG
jgi:hypothetical protein